MDDQLCQINAIWRFARRAEDPFYSSIVKLYRARAKVLNIVARCVLVATAVIIAVGIWIFWSGDAPDAKITESEAKVRADLIVLNGTLLKERSKISNAEQQKTLCESAKRLTARLKAIGDSVQSVVSMRTKDQAESANAAIEKGKEVLEALQAKPLQDVTIDIRKYEPDDSGRFSAAALALIIDASKTTQSNIELLKKAVEPLHAALQTLKAVGVQETDKKWREEDVRT